MTGTDKTYHPATIRFCAAFSYRPAHLLYRTHVRRCKRAKVNRARTAVALKVKSPCPAAPVSLDDWPRWFIVDIKQLFNISFRLYTYACAELCMYIYFILIIHHLVETLFHKWIFDANIFECAVSKYVGVRTLINMLFMQFAEKAIKNIAGVRFVWLMRHPVAPSHVYQLAYILYLFKTASIFHTYEIPLCTLCKKRVGFIRCWVSEFLIKPNVTGEENERFRDRRYRRRRRRLPYTHRTCTYINSKLIFITLIWIFSYCHGI